MLCEIVCAYQRPRKLSDIPDGQQKGGLLKQLVLPVLIALIAGGTSPWWFNALFSKPSAKQSTSEYASSPASPVASRDFMIGRWQVQQAAGSVSGETVADYFADGRVEDTENRFEGDTGRKVQDKGTWDFEKLSDSSFRLSVQFDNGSSFQGKFEILDQNRVHNIDQNYIANRLR